MPAGIRPTQDLLRAAVFDLIGQDMDGLTFLDLYAGSGAMGFEAVSRGAAQAVLVEKDPKNAKVIAENCQIIGLDGTGRIQIIDGDALATAKDLGSQSRHFDIVFFDPPFGRRLAKKTLKVINDSDILHGHSFIIAQNDVSERLEVPENLKVVIERRYGSSMLTIMQKNK